ncbi:unnamed protein product [Mytilus edulis]|uniref:Uncharacterized protein n=1 Tax=Mytilus edulis TaxID=6550 RepID=A0A8S3SM84_MYTED|nr:unnamed protein product [Mytilus edulis]
MNIVLICRKERHKQKLKLKILSSKAIFLTYCSERYVANMNLEDKNLSVQFYNYLCNIVGSEEVVRTRRGIFAVKDILENTTGSTSISSGSKAEGLDLKETTCSKTDLIGIIIRHYWIHNDLFMDHNGFLCFKLKLFQITDYNKEIRIRLYDVQSYPGIIPLVMVNNDTKPGFTKIKLVNNAYFDTCLTLNWSETVGEETFISSKRVRKENLSFHEDLVMHWPCQSTSDGQYDKTVCFRCNEWITSAQQ